MKFNSVPIPILWPLSSRWGVISCDSALVQSGSSQNDDNEGDKGIISGDTGAHDNQGGGENWGPASSQFTRNI